MRDHVLAIEMRLREGRQRSDEMRRVREDVEKLQQDNRELRDRVNRLETQVGSGGTGK